MKRAAVAGLILGASGCRGVGAATTSPNGARGSLGGKPLPVRDAISNVATATGFDFAGPSTIVVLSDFASACSLRASDRGFPNGRLLAFGLAVIDEAGKAAPATEVGTYAIGQYPLPKASRSAEAFYEEDDSSCLKTFSEQASSGIVTLTAVNAGDAGAGVTGRFDVTFASSGDHVAGTFSAPTCTSLDPNHTPVGGCM